MNNEDKQKLEMTFRIGSAHQTAIMQIGNDLRDFRLETARTMKESIKTLEKLQDLPEQIRIVIECVKQINDNYLILAEELEILKKEKSAQKRKKGK